MDNDVVSQIKAFNAGRDPVRLQLKYNKMRASPFAFMRGTCHLFYARLPKTDVLRQAPLSWVCGDLHLENFGSYKGDNRLVYFDVNDFDESALAPLSWDLIRMLTSLWIAADSLGISRSQAGRLCQEFLESYAVALAHGKAYWVERDTAQSLIGELLEGLRERQRSDFLDSRTECKGKKRWLKLDSSKALPVTDSQRSRVTHFMNEFAKTQADPEFFQVIDVAQRIAGTGSLGVERYVVLIRGKASPDNHYLLDLKQSLPSSLLPHLPVAQPAWRDEAHRVVELQRRMQAVSMAFLQAVTLDGQPFVLRGLQASEDRVTMDRSIHSIDQMSQTIQTMAKMVAWAQLRSSGRGGSAIADQLIEYGLTPGWQHELLELSRHCAEQVMQDAAVFAAAFAAGELAH